MNYSKTTPNYVLAEIISSASSFLNYPMKLHPAAKTQISQLSSGIFQLQTCFPIVDLISLVISPYVILFDEWRRNCQVRVKGLKKYHQVATYSKLYLSSRQNLQ